MMNYDYFFISTLTTLVIQHSSVQQTNEKKNLVRTENVAGSSSVFFGEFVAPDLHLCSFLLLSIGLRHVVSWVNAFHL